jgi:peptidyl-tRNA hydrolase
MAKRTKHLSEQSLISLSFLLTLNQRVPGSSPGAPTKSHNIFKQIEFLKQAGIQSRIKGGPLADLTEIKCGAAPRADSAAGPGFAAYDNRWRILAAYCSERHYTSMKASSGRGRGSSRAGRDSDRKRTVANATAAGPADEVLEASDLPISVVTELGRAQIPPEKFAAVLSAFGRLSEWGQYTLAVRIINVSKVYELRKLVEKQQFPLPHQQRECLNRIGASAKGLLALLGVEEAKSVASGVRRGSIHPTVGPSLLLGLYRVAVERRPTATASADERLTTLILLLSDLAEAAERCALDAGTQYRPGRGGERRAGQITAEVQLVQGVIESYAELRNRFPSSGPPPAFDKRLRKFVRSGLKLVASASRFVDSDLPKPSRITDAAIRGAFNRWLAQTKAKAVVDLNYSNL